MAKDKTKKDLKTPVQPGYPSVQSFYKREVVHSTIKKGEDLAHKAVRQGDGFTEEELADALDPMNKKWNPDRDYEEMTIAELLPGPKAVLFMGRIVNLNTSCSQTPKQPKASGWHYMLVRDNSATISIKLYFSKTQYPVKLGQLISVWTTFLADKQGDSTVMSSIPVYANLFPGRVTSDHVMIHTNPGTDNLCRIPLGYIKGQPLSGLMALDSYLKGGHDGVKDAKILAEVKSIGARKKIARKTGGEAELATVSLIDHTGEMRWTLWNEMIDSAKDWQPGKTILLISNPGYKVEYAGQGSIGVQPTTMIDVNPDFQDAEWLRRHIESLTKKESLCLDFPEEVWDIEAAENGANVILFTLAEIDQWVREEPSRTFTGHISVTILELSLVLHYRRNMLLCSTCCGVPVYSNTPTTPCRNCDKPLSLFINPKIIGTLVDETGCIAPGKLLWSERAWEQLLGRSKAEMCEMKGEEIRWLEQRMAFMRMHLVVGWEEGVGRLAVLGMRA